MAARVRACKRRPRPSCGNAFRLPPTPSTPPPAGSRPIPALGVGGDSPALSIRRTDVICPVEECDDDGDEDLDHSEALAQDSSPGGPIGSRSPFDLQRRPLHELAIHLYTVLNGNQFILVDDCSVHAGESLGPVCGDQGCNDDAITRPPHRPQPRRRLHGEIRRYKTASSSALKPARNVASRPSRTPCRAATDVLQGWGWTMPPRVRQ